VEQQAEWVRVTYETDGRTHTVEASQVIVAIPAFMAADIVKNISNPLEATLRNVPYCAGTQLSKSYYASDGYTP